MPEPRPPSVAPASNAEVPAPPGDGARPDPLAAEVARAVRELRIAAGLSERAAARRLGTSQTQLRRMEDPRYLPSLRSLARVATAYGHRLLISFENKERLEATQPAAAGAGAKGAAGAGRSSSRSAASDAASLRPMRTLPGARERARRAPRATDKTGGPKSDRAARGRDARQRPGARRRKRQ